jgi:hypothetical protein
MFPGRKEFQKCLTCAASAPEKRSKQVSRATNYPDVTVSDKGIRFVACGHLPGAEFRGELDSKPEPYETKGLALDNS